MITLAKSKLTKNDKKKIIFHIEKQIDNLKLDTYYLGSKKIFKNNPTAETEKEQSQKALSKAPALHLCI